MKPLVRHLIAALLFAPAAFASDGRDRGAPAIDILRPMELTLEDGARFRPARLVAPGRDGPVSAPIPYPVDTRDEDRIGLNWLPVIGGVLEPTANLEFAGALPVGAAWRVGDALLIGFDEGLVAGDITDGVRVVVIANMDRSYRIPVDFSAKGAAYSDDIPASAARTRIGRVLLARGALLVIVTPSLVDPEG